MLGRSEWRCEGQLLLLTMLLLMLLPPPGASCPLVFHRVGREVLDAAHAVVAPGVTTDEIDRVVSRPSYAGGAAAAAATNNMPNDEQCQERQQLVSINPAREQQRSPGPLTSPW